MTHNKLSPYVPFWVEMVNGKPSNPCRETLVEPKLTPPIHGNEVTEPLVGKFVGDDVGNPNLVLRIRRLLVEQNGSGTICHQAPVLHGAVGELVHGEEVRLG